MPDFPELDVPEIIVRDTRERGFTLQRGLDPFGYEYDQWEAYADQWDTGAGGGGGGAGFVAPELTPEVKKIVSKPAIRPPFNPALAAPKLALPAFLAMIGGVLVKAILEDRGQALLDEEYRVLMAKGTRTQYDTPVFAEPQVVPEIITTGKRQQTRSDYQLPPLPEFFPDFATPFELAPAVSPGVASPGSAPAPVVQPMTIPSPAPFRIPSPAARPLAQPWAMPFAQPSPLADPLAQPSADPRAKPKPRTSPKPRTRAVPRTGTNPLTRLGPSTLPLPSPQAQPSRARSRRCPPCKKGKKREEPRTKCWKKLVKEGLYPSQDTSYEWVPLDCITGRELI